ncbi:hypothetical protein ABZ599_32860 [Streptomyces misionensis]|uniref:hypothetical protein n=1 Tax=Streptomyces misionensis TaxID=67331 RepID=UPI00340CAD7B
MLLALSATRTVPFAGQTMDQWLTGILEEIRDLYRADQVPWVVGYMHRSLTSQSPLRRMKKKRNKLAEEAAARTRRCA